MGEFSRAAWNNCTWEPVVREASQPARDGGSDGLRADFVANFEHCALERQLHALCPERAPGADHFNRTVSSIELSWDGAWQRQTDQAGPIEYFELQQRAIYSSNEWQNVSGVGASVSDPLTQDEVQIITVRADQGQTVRAGWFQLAFHFGGCSVGDPDCAVVTGEITHDASSGDVEAALEALENIDRVRVVRCDEAGFLGSGPTGAGGSAAHCPYAAVGGYSWHVRFDTKSEMQLNPRTHELQALNEGNMPMLTLHKETINGRWTGPGPQVLVSELRRGGVVHASGCGGRECRRNVTAGLAAGELYAFRLRAHGPLGFSKWTLPTAPTGTLRNSVPPSPPAPLYSSSTGTSLTVVLAAGAPAPTDLPVEAYAFQVRRAGPPPAPWEAAGEAAPAEGARWASATARGLAPGVCPCELRARARNAAGWGPWGPPSRPLAAAAAPGVPRPPPPQVVAVGARAVGLRWLGAGAAAATAAAGDGGGGGDDPPLLDGCPHGVDAYHVQYQRDGDPGWTAPRRGDAGGGGGGGGGGMGEGGHVAAAPPDAGARRASSRITVRADMGAAAVAEGHFWLGVAGRGATTAPIPYNARAAGVKEAIEEVSGAGTVHTVRRHKPGNHRSQAPGDLGQYSWHVVWASPECPRFFLHKENITSLYTGPGEQVLVEHLSCGKEKQCLRVLAATVDGLEPYTNYRFRVRAANGSQYGEWSEPTETFRTEPLLLQPLLSFEGEEDPPATGFELVAGDGATAPRTEDKDYVHGVAAGGGVGADGGPGMVVILLPGRAGAQRTVFSYTGRPQTYVVPEDSGPGGVASWGRRLSVVLVKAWGAGGGGGGPGRGTGTATGLAGNGTSADDASALASGEDYSLGGAGGFARARVRVAPGEALEVVVGGGGGGYAGRAGGAGGYNGGAPGGAGQFGGAGGGGRSEVRRQAAAGAAAAAAVAVAGGGGGGGATDYCCAAGGAGGGAAGAAGGAPGGATPVDNAGGGARTWEYTPEDCAAAGSGCVDPRDRTGLPAEHLHIDHGLAPGADYSVLARGGGGGGAAGAGAAGVSGSYAFSLGGVLGSASGPGGEESVRAVTGAALSPNASDGAAGRGGRGADGKEGGGGGGGGWYGGGGGGSGVDGAGGGGGSGHVSLADLFQLEDLYAEGVSGYHHTAPGAPSAPWLTFLDHAHFVVEWLPPSEPRLGQEVAWYDVEVALERDSLDYKVAARVAATGPRATGGARGEAAVAGLAPGTGYRVRTVAVAASGARSPPSPALGLTTDPSPENAWEVVRPRRLKRARGGRGLSAPVMNRPHLDPRAQVYADDGSEDPDRYADPPGEREAVRPAGRRGHTLTAVPAPSGANEGLLLFGGWSEGEVCDGAITDTLSRGDVASGAEVEQCRNGRGNSNEAWWFDPVTQVWDLLDTEGARPPPREWHSTTEVDGKLYVFGGRAVEPVPLNSSSNATVLREQQFFNDLWMLDPQQDQVSLVQSGDTGDLDEGAYNFFAADVSSDDEYCIVGLEVEVAFAHPCTRQLQLSLHGPGPTDAATANFYPDRAGQRRNLFLHHDWTPGTGCRGGNNTLRFNDGAARGIDECCAAPPYDGTAFRPVEGLSAFYGVPASGEWALAVYDRVVDGTNGTLQNWALSFTMERCEREFTWTNLTLSPGMGQSPPARFQHTSVAVGNQIYVWGGLNNQKLADMWRYDIPDMVWTELTPEEYSVPELAGRAAHLGPWGLAAFGGARAPSALAGGGGAAGRLEHRVWLQDMITEEWAALEVRNPPCTTAPHRHRADGTLKGRTRPALCEAAPHARYGAAAAAVLPAHSGAALLRRAARPAAALPPALLVHGGYDGAHHSGELYRLRAAALGTTSFLPAEKDRFCTTLLASNSQIESHWNTTCAETQESGSSCDPHDILQRAWCREQYQSCGNL